MCIRGRPFFQGGVDVRYSPQGRTADEIIMEILREEKDRAMVVSSDREILEEAKRLRASTIQAPAFFDKLQMALAFEGSFDKDLYDLPPEEVKSIPTVCGSLREAMESLDKDREFLTQGDVFTDDQIDAYIALKFEEIHKFEHAPHPVEFEMYYSN